MTATTPHGLRRMKASFSAISEASTSPIGIRPVPKTYWIMCSPSTTSARHSLTTLPHSRAMSWARESVSRLTSWARLSNSSARRIRLVRRQAGYAARAAATAWWASSAPALGKTPISFAGMRWAAAFEGAGRRA